MSQPVAASTLLDPIPFAVLIDEAWRATRRHARALLVPAALAMLPGVLGLQTLMAVFTISMADADPARDGIGGFLAQFALVMAGAVVFLVWIGIVLGSLTVAAIRAATGEAPSFWGALRFYLRWRVWGTDLLARLLMGLGFLACLLPGVFLSLAWAARLQVMAIEGRIGLDALGRSWEVMGYNPRREWTRHPLLKVLLLFVLGAVLGSAVRLVIEAPVAILQQVMMIREMAGGEGGDPEQVMRAMLWLSIPSGLLSALAQLPVQLYVYFATTTLFLDQLRRKEGADLRAAIDALVGAPAAPPAPSPPAAPSPFPAS